VFGELLLTAGVIVLLFVAYTLWGTGIQTAQAQDSLRQDFDAAAPASPEETVDPSGVAIGDGYALLRIPRFGDDWEKVVVQGVEDEDLKNGPGHYPTSADPGEIGNFSIAAHRSGHGEPFAAFPELRVGDTIEVQLADGRTWVYQIDDAPDGNPDGNRIDISDSWVVNPFGMQEPPDAEPTERRITLTTCWPRYGSSHRMYATGILVEGPEV
jgi:LPXTG-site transpeptidase (sortase) family protein